jgi:hypothetical protein
MISSLIGGLACLFNACSIVDGTVESASLSTSGTQVAGVDVVTQSNSQELPTSTFAAARSAANAPNATADAEKAPTFATPLTPLVVDTLQNAELAQISAARSASPVTPSDNYLTIRNPYTTALTTYPLQVGRIFVKGEIAGCPNVFLDGSRLDAAQVRVKNRYPDGSVKFAHIAAVVNGLSPGQVRRVSFVNGTCSNDVGPSMSTLLAKYPKLDTAIKLNGGAAGSASLKQQLTDGAFSTWIDGPISSTYIVSDHRAKRYDIGLDANKSIRPVFHLTMWHGLGIAQVRVIGEQSDTEKMQNQTYSLQITGGLTANNILYEQSTVNHNYAGRWTKRFWLGASVPEVDVLHNVRYLAATKALPNYDASVTYAAAAKTALLNKWAAVPASNKEVFGSGLLYKYMPGAGGRPDIGLFTEWTIAALYDGDSRLWELLKANTDLAAAWPMHFREGGAGRNFITSPVKSDGLGKPATRDGRNRLFFWDGNGYWGRFSVNKPSEPIAVGAKDNNGWVPDCAHQPDDHYLLYLTSGDYWYLEQLQFWASWGTFFTDVSYPPPGMVPEDAWFDTQIRGEAWCMRTRARAAFASVDGTPEQMYFGRITESALRVFEGQKIGANGQNATRDWWASYTPPQQNALRYWKHGAAAPTNGSREEIAPWQVWFVYMSLGHIEELGFSSGELLKWLAPFQIQMTSTSGFNPQHLADYQFPVRSLSAGFPVYQSLNAIETEWQGWASKWIEYQPDLQHGYPSLASAGASFIANQPGGGANWNWFLQNHYTKVNWGNNPKWAILPR